MLAFVAAHPLGGTRTADLLRVRHNVLSVAAGGSGGYLASVLCDFMRRRWLAAGESFTFETVMSNEDKVALLADARQRGYRTYLYYVCTDSAVINRERVAARVAQGGHNVPWDKLASRYARSLSFAPAAIRLCSRAYLFDNSGASHRLVAGYLDGRLARIAPDPPAWLVSSILDHLP